MQTVHPGNKSDRTLFTVGRGIHTACLGGKEIISQFLEFLIPVYVSVSPRKKKNQNSGGIFKLELEPASQPSEAIMSLWRASTARSNVRGNGFCVQFTSSNNTSTWVNLARKYTGRNPPVLQAYKDQIHRAVWSLAIIHTY